jgi:predicted N-acetyltransferase YhbS
MEFVELGPLTPELKSELEGDEQDPFDAAGLTLEYRAKDRHVGLRDASGQLVASAGMLIVEVEVGEERFAVVGLGGVIVNARHRGRGLARKVVDAALARAATLGPAFALLFCHEDRAGLYRKLGFVVVEDEVVVEQPDGFAALPQLAMWRRLHDRATWPGGPLTVHSLPF